MNQCRNYRPTIGKYSMPESKIFYDLTQPPSFEQKPVNSCYGKWIKIHLLGAKPYTLPFSHLPSNEDNLYEKAQDFVLRKAKIQIFYYMYIYQIRYVPVKEKIYTKLYLLPFFSSF